MGLFLLGIGTYVGIIACVWMISSAFRDGGVLGVIMLIAWIFICALIASVSHGDDKKKK